MSENQDEYEISIICALSLEAAAVKALFDGIENSNEEKATKSSGDVNSYTTGAIGGKKVVLAHLAGEGKIPAAAAATDLKHTFKNIKLCLLVGICGGVPGDIAGNIALGDVIIGRQVVHYDFGRQHEHKFERKDGPEDGLSRQGPAIRAFVRKLESGKGEIESKAFEYLNPMLEKLNNTNFESLADELYPTDYWHVHKRVKDCQGKRCENERWICDAAVKASCEELNCDRSELDPDRKRKEKPNIYFGSIASGDKVMRSATLRDIVAKEEGIIAFDMEGAGVWDYLPCVLVKGVCDYADSHKNKTWQEYAATSAAAFTKALLEQWDTADKSSQQYQVKNLFNNYNSKILNQADKIFYSGTNTFNL